MSDETDDLTDPEGTGTSAEPAVDQSLDAWGDSTAEDTWTPIEVEGDGSGAGSAEPAPTTIEATAEEDEPEPVKPEPVATPAAESRADRTPSGASPYSSVAKSSTRTSGGRRRRPSSLRDEEHVTNLPRRPVAPPTFQPAASPRAAAHPAGDSAPAPTGAPPGSLPEKVFALTRERPEVGLGLAFFGGLVLATIIKRLGRR